MHDAHENRQISIFDKGTDLEFAEHTFDDARFYSKIDKDGIPITLLVKDKDFFFKRGEKILEKFIYDEVIEPKFDIQEELISFLFDVLSTEDSTAIKNTITVKNQADFGSPIGDNITLKAGFTYLVNDEVIVSKNLILSDNVLVKGTNRAIDAIKFEGAFGFIQNLMDGCFNIESLMLTSTAGELFNITGVNALYRIANCNIVDNFQLGTINDSETFVLINCLITGTTSRGFIFAGTNNGLINILECFSKGDNAGVLFDFNGTWNVIDVDHLLSIFSAGQTVFKDGGLTLTQGRLTICNFIDAGGTLTDGFTKGTPEWKFLSNLGVADSEIAGEVFFNGNATNTVISTAGVAVKILGTTTNGFLERFISVGNNRLQYKGIEDVKINIQAKMSMQAVVGNNQACKVYIAKNGVIVAKTIGSDTLTSQNLDQIMIANGIIDMVTDDFIEVFAENTTSTNDLLATDMSLIIHEK